MSKSNFTLIELLIVIAIIAVLASMLLPALDKARSQAKTMQCLSNQKSMSAGMILYSDDNNSQLPTHYGRAINEGGIRYGSTWWMWQLVKTYRYSKKTFICPANPHNSASDNLTGWNPGLGMDDGWKLHDSSKLWYSMNGRLLKSRPDWKPEGTGTAGKTSRIKTPSQTVIILEYRVPTFVDGVSSINSTLSRFATQDVNIRDHYNVGSVFATIDGHTEKLRYAYNPNALYFEGNPELIILNNWCHGRLWHKQ